MVFQDLLLDMVQPDTRRCSARCAPGTSPPRGTAAGRRRCTPAPRRQAVLTLTRKCATSVLMPPLPPTYISQPESTPITPTSLMPASAQLRGQPETANLTLCGAYMRHMRALQVLAHLGAVLRAHAAPFAADTGLHGAQRLGIGVAAGHADVFPDVDQVFFLHAQQVDALAAGDLDGGDLVLVHRVGNAAQFVWRWSAPPHMRGMTE